MPTDHFTEDTLIVNIYLKVLKLHVSNKVIHNLYIYICMRIFLYFFACSK